MKEHLGFRVSEMYNSEEISLFFNEVQPSPGDLLEFNRIRYKHWAVYIGENDGQFWVIHFANEDFQPWKTFSNTVTSVHPDDPNYHQKGAIRLDTVTTVLATDSFRLSNFSDSYWTPLPPDEIVDNAFLALANHTEPYDVITNNCEHFAYRCRYGVHYSGQVSRSKKAVAILGFGIVVGTGIAFGPMTALLAGGGTAVTYFLATMKMNLSYVSRSAQSVTMEDIVKKLPSSVMGPMNVGLVAENIATSAVVQKLVVDLMMEVTFRLLKSDYVQKGRFKELANVSEKLIDVSSKLRNPLVRLAADAVEVVYQKHYGKVKENGRQATVFDLLADRAINEVADKVLVMMKGSGRLNEFLGALVDEVGGIYGLDKKQVMAFKTRVKFDWVELRGCVRLLVNAMIRMTLQSPPVQAGFKKVAGKIM